MTDLVMFLSPKPPGASRLLMSQINLLCTFYVPGTVLGIRVKTMNKTKFLVLTS